MELNHLANSNTWTKESRELNGSFGVRDVKNYRQKVIKYNPMCYGCGSQFETDDELLTHLVNKHMVVV